MIRIYENRVEVTEILDDNKARKIYYPIDSEIGQQLIKENNLEIEND